MSTSALADEPVERGPWRVIRPGTREVAIMSDDFTHDVILGISGDFADDVQRTAYAELIVKRLNLVCGVTR